MNNIFRNILCIVGMTILLLGVVSDVIDDRHTSKTIDSLNTIVNNAKAHQDSLNIMKKSVMILYGITEYEAEIYTEIASKCTGDWSDYIAMIKIESSFKTGLMSSKGARGLTQVMPLTMKSMCNKMDISYDESTAWNDVLNIVIGFKYLEDAIKSDSINRFRIYVGGPDWKKSQCQDYISQYDKAMRRESKILNLVYRGLK